ncbi:type III secretion system needle filament subunit SctF [Robbsia sp. Bb-Pol-6]|uniref:Type III secretion system needle filament subunit SctF n=2 Tax=Robbsia betulipollinis TaxID=2981849 RepID=A0ABT3ZL03_9BURK|nr:type III secretion system needle filament subunit SctF [Robbsia betulipollinis]MCY0387209.1 type III secretion system needle filament subunit SctF [Robbsia betulipollinis]
MFIIDIAKGFNTGVGSLGSALDAALAKLQSSPSDPSALANYQALLSEYNMYRNAQSSAVKAMKDIDTDIAGKLR